MEEKRNILVHKNTLLKRLGTNTHTRERERESTATTTE